MRAHGDILLVSCYELGRQPLAIAWAAAALTRAGYAPRCLDLAVEPLDEPALAAARLTVLSVPMHTALRLGVRVIERARALREGGHIAATGLYAVLNRDYLRRLGVHSILGGEAEEALVALAAALERGEAAAPAAAQGTTLRRLPLAPPERAGLPPLERYARLEIDGERRLAGAVETTRGCLHMCRHCPIPPVYGGRFFAVDADTVLADVRAQVAAGARHITFADADFLNGPRHALAVARRLHAEHPTVTFDATIKVEHILKHRAQFPALRALGCIFVVSAFESLSERVLAILDKGHTAAGMHEALAIVRDAGISLRPTFVPFTPWSSLDDLAALCAFVREHSLAEEVDPVQLTLRLLIPPGSLLATHPETIPHLGELDEVGLTWTWRHTDPRVDALQARAAALVEQAAADGEAPAATFVRLESLVRESAGLPAPAPAATRREPPRQRPPKLTESWFC